MATPSKETVKILVPTIVSYTFFNEKGQQRGGNMMVHASNPADARKLATDKLRGEYQYFKITKVKPFESDNPQESL